MMKKPGPELNNAFFDCHLHLYNLSHAGFLAYINRALLNKSITLNDLIKNRYFTIIMHAFGSPDPVKNILNKAILFLILAAMLFAGFLFGKVLFFDLIMNYVSLWLWLKIFLSICVGFILTMTSLFWIIKLILKNGTKKVINLLSVMENDIAGTLLNMEMDYLRLLLEKKMETDGSLKKRVSRIDNLLKKERITAERARKMYICIIKKMFVVPGNENEYDFKAGGLDFNKVILIPLIMDFNNKGYVGNEHIYYNLPPDKPVVEQVVDMFNGMKRYNQKSDFKIFEVYPFMGINPNNYDWRDNQVFRAEKGSLTEILIKKIKKLPHQCQGKLGIFKEHDETTGAAVDILIPIEKINAADKEAIKKLLKGGRKVDRENFIQTLVKESEQTGIRKLFYKYFGNYHAKDDLYGKFSENYQDQFVKGNYNSNIDKIRTFFFAGIKLYPPLGFNPWPEEKPGKKYTNEEKEKIEIEQKKVRFIYDFCVHRGIPLTVHCQLASFGTIDKEKKEEYTNPGKWERIFALEKYHNLKVNFAHMGFEENSVEKKAWTVKIFDEHFKKPNVYGDFSCKATVSKGSDFYRKFGKIMENYKDKFNRILFGTDFPILLFLDNSYKEYLEFFFNDPSFTDKEKKQFYNINPKRFLFSLDK
jgi:predicted TIM-barrel fold metal-dependent hydrolase